MALAVARPEQPFDDRDQEPGCIATAPASTGSRLHFAWGLGPHLKLCEGRSPETSQGGSNPCSTTVAWSAPTMHQRRIYHEVLPYYQQLRQQLHQQGRQPGRPLEVRETLLMYSHTVRDILASMRSDPIEPPETQDELQVLYEAALWHLLEIFFLHSGISDGFFVEAFVQWTQQHGSLLHSTPGFAELDYEAARLAQEPRLEKDPAYWRTIARFTALGQLKGAGDLLLMHPAYKAQAENQSQVDLLEGVYNLMRRTPRLRQTEDAELGYFVDDPNAFLRERQEWQADVRRMVVRDSVIFADVAAQDPAMAQGLQNVLAVMSGSEDTTALQAATHNWVELVTAHLMWKHPGFKPLHMRQLVQHCRSLAEEQQEDQGNKEFLDFLEEIICAAAELEAQQLVQLATNTNYADLWFVAHMYDILRGYPEAERVIARPLPHLGGDQNEMYTLHFAATLMGQASTWQVAAAYLAWCPVHGADATEAMLDSLPFVLTDKRAAHKALALCEQHGLSSSAQSLCRRLGMAAAQQGQVGEVLKWLLRAHDEARCAAVVQPLISKVGAALQEHLGSYEVRALQLPELQELEPLLECVPGAGASDGDVEQDGVDGQASTRPYPELHFLRSFLQLQHAAEQLTFQQQQQQQQQHGQQGAALRLAHAAARQPLLELLCLGLAPMPLRLPLMFYALPWLESDASAFTQEDVQRLMRVLQATADAQAAGLEPDSDGMAPRYVQDVRLALARSLARTHVLEVSQRARALAAF